MFHRTHRLRSIFQRHLSTAQHPNTHSPSSTSSSSSFSSTSSASSKTPSTATWIFFGTPVVLTFSLGVWQVKRLFRKNLLIEDRKKRLYGNSLTCDQLFEQHDGIHDLNNNNNKKDIDFQSVILRGRFLHDLEMHVGPRSAPKHLPPAVLQWGGSSGLQVVTPCLLENERIVLVNRGWIPHRLVDDKKRRNASVSPLTFLLEEPKSESLSDYLKDDYIELKGVVRNEQERNQFMPKNLPHKNEWFYIDAEQMIQSCGLQQAEQNPIIVELCQPVPLNGWPFPRTLDQFLEFRTPPSTHVTYAVTWFSLSAALAFLMRARLRKIA